MPSRTGRVHVATTSRLYKGKLYQTHLLRRTFRAGSQVRHETLGNISHLPPHLIELIRRSLAGETFLPASGVFRIERSLPHGHVQAVLGSLRKLGLDSLIASKPCRERDLVMAMIAERLLDPCSKLATTRLWHTTTLAEELGVADCDEDDLYRAMNWLLARQARIEAKLAQRHLRNGAIVLYDVSSSYYEGHTCPLARFGHDRDRKKGRPIIVYGLLADGEGRPIAIEVYPGNTGDPTTVPDQVGKLRQRFGLSRVVLVGDRGMLTETQIGKLREHPGLGWISALRGPAIRELVEAGCLQLSLFDQANLAEISSPEYPGERLVACFNPVLAEERRRKREELLQATEKELDRIGREVTRRKRKPLPQAGIALKVGKVLNRFKVAKHFELTIADGMFSWQRRPDSIPREAALDGVYVVRTSEDSSRCSGEDAVRRYKSLAQVERAFRCLKGIDLRIRPIHHRTADHVRAHILLCMLAYYVEWHMRQALAPLLFEDQELTHDRKRRDPVAPAEPSNSAKRKKAEHVTAGGFEVHSFETLLAVLGTRCRNTCSLPADASSATFQQLTEPTPLQARAFELLGV
ncbi:MAG: IS1634 family transposase [Terriglobia bacterium]|jgi:transposase